MRRYRLTIQARITLAYGLLFLLAGTVMIAIIYIALRYVPNYSFAVPRSTTPLPSDMDTAPGDNPYANTINVSDTGELLTAVLWSSVGALAVVAIAGLVAGWFLAKRLLAPIHQISAAAIRASTGDLDHRIPFGGPTDELAELSGTFNSMLGKLQDSFNATERFAANASHELMTPLAANRTILQVARANPQDVDHDEVLKMLHMSNERSIAISRSLLELTSIQHARFTLELVDISACLEAVVLSHRHAPAGSPLRWHVEIEPGIQLPAQPVLVTQLLQNLLDNAVKYNLPAGEVSVVAAFDGAQAQIVISNSGPVVPGNDLSLVFEPFYRTDQRTASGEVARGHGLGLAIASAIANRHGGALTASAGGEGGLVMTLSLPTGPGA